MNTRVMENKQPLNLDSTRWSGTLTKPKDEGSPIELWLVEDNDEIREALAELLNTQPGIQCARTFASAEAMLGALRQEPAPHLILSDLNLPGRSGVQAIGSVRSLAPATPVLIMTTFYDGTQETAALKAGAAGFLTKSCGVDDFVRMIRQACVNTQPASSMPEKADGPRGPKKLPLETREEPIAVPWGARAFGILRAAMAVWAERRRATL